MIPFTIEQPNSMGSDAPFTEERKRTQPYHELTSCLFSLSSSPFPYLPVMLPSDTILQQSSKIAARTRSRTQSNGMSTVDPSDPPSYGMSSSGEPLETVAPLGKKIAVLPFKRRVDFRLFPDGKPIIKDLKDASRNTAAWAQTRGIQVSPSCDYCAAGNGPFASCVVVRNGTGQQFFEGTCANCQFGRRGPKCSLRSMTSSAIPSDSLLKEFQSARPTSDSQVHREPRSSLRARSPSVGDPQANKKRRLDNPRPSSAADPIPRRPLDEADKPRAGGSQHSADPIRRRPAQPNTVDENRVNRRSTSDLPARRPVQPQPNAKTNESRVNRPLPFQPLSSGPNSPLFVPPDVDTTGLFNSCAPSLAPDQTPCRPAQSKANGTVLPFPLPSTMYNDAGLLRQGVKDLTRFLRLAQTRLRVLEAPANSEYDLWGDAMSALEKLSEMEQQVE